MSELAKFTGGVPATADALMQGLANVQQNISTPQGMPFLKLKKSGKFAFGQENIEPEIGSEWAVNPYAIAHGFAAWGDGELLGEVMVPVTQAAPDINSLPDYGVKWGQQMSLTMQCLTGEDKGINVIYKGTSVGFRNAVKDLMGALTAQLQADQSKFVPVVELGVDSYEHKKFGEIYFPILNVLRWISMDGEAASAPAREEAPEVEEVDESEGAVAPSTTRRRRRT